MLARWLGGFCGVLLLMAACGGDEPEGTTHGSGLRCSKPSAGPDKTCLCSTSEGPPFVSACNKTSLPGIVSCCADPTFPESGYCQCDSRELGCFEQAGAGCKCESWLAGTLAPPGTPVGGCYPGGAVTQAKAEPGKVCCLKARSCYCFVGTTKCEAGAETVESCSEARIGAACNEGFTPTISCLPQ